MKGEEFVDLSRADQSSTIAHRARVYAIPPEWSERSSHRRTAAVQL